MIDAIYFLDKGPYLAELNYVMGLLNHLVQALAASSSNLIFKVLVTNTTLNSKCRSWFPHSVELNMSGEFSLNSPHLDGLNSTAFPGVPTRTMGL